MLKTQHPSNQNAGPRTPLPMKSWMHFSHCHLDLVHAVAMVMFIKRVPLFPAQWFISIHNSISLGRRLVELELYIMLCMVSQYMFAL